MQQIHPTARDLVAEICRVERLMASPEGKGKMTILKAYHRKLYRRYLKVCAEAEA